MTAQMAPTPMRPADMMTDAELAIGVARHHRTMGRVDLVAELAAGDQTDLDDLGQGQAVFQLMCQAATRYSELLGTQRVDDVVGPLVENLEIDIVGPGWTDDSLLTGRPAEPEPRHRG